ncbi:MAG: hypothetical protein ABDH66_04015 [Bacteroidia bacterium]
MKQNWIQTIKSRLSKGALALPNEYAIYNGIIIPVLHAVGWHPEDTEEVVPQYSTGEGRVDFALRKVDVHTGKRVSFTFIEVKHLGKADEEAEKQLLRYAFQEGVPLLVLTDGQQWRFYHPLSAGPSKERMIEEIDLLSDSEEKCLTILQKYLGQNRYLSLRDFHSFIAQEYHARFQRAHLRRIWKALLSGEDKALLELLREKLSAGLNISSEELPLDKLQHWLSEELKQVSPSQSTLSFSLSMPTQRGVFVKGIFHPAKKLKEIGRILCEQLAALNEEFPEKFYNSKFSKGAKRLYIAPDPEKVFPDSFKEKNPKWKKYLIEFSDQKGRRWWLMTHFSQKMAEEVFKQLVASTGLPWGNPEGVKIVF